MSDKRVSFKKASTKKTKGDKPELDVYAKGESAALYKNRKWICIAVSVGFLVIGVCFIACIYLLCQITTFMSIDDLGRLADKLLLSGTSFFAGVGAILCVQRMWQVGRQSLTG